MNDSIRKFVVVLILLVTACVVLSGCAHEDPWTRSDTVRQLTVTGLIAADAYATSRIKDDPYCAEGGSHARFWLGDQPDTSDTILYFTGIAVSDYLISRALPAKWRPYWQGFTLIDHGNALVGHCGL